MWKKIFIGAVTLHTARIVTMIVINLRDIIPEFWHWVTIISLLLGIAYIYSKIPEPKRHYLRLTDEIKIALSGLAIGTLLGLTYL